MELQGNGSYLPAQEFDRTTITYQKPNANMNLKKTIKLSWNPPTK
jgi:hypothetical protein